MRTGFFAAARLVALALLLTLAPGAGGVAQAHAVLLRADPADGAVLGGAPPAVHLWFSQPVALDAAGVSLVSAGGERVAPASVTSATYQPAKVGLGDQFDPTYLYLCSVGQRTLPTEVIVELPPLRPEAYELSWRGVALDDYRSTSGRLAFAVGPAHAVGEPAAASSATARAADLLVSLDVAPNRPGRNFIRLGVFDTRRPAPAPVESVEVRLVPPGGAEPVVLAAEPVGRGRYQVGGDSIGRAGEWEIGVTVRRAGLPDATARLAWTVLAPGAPVPPAAPPLAPGGPGPAPLALGAVLLACCAAGGAALAWRARLRRG